MAPRIGRFYPFACLFFRLAAQYAFMRSYWAFRAAAVRPRLFREGATAVTPGD